MSSPSRDEEQFASYYTATGNIDFVCTDRSAEDQMLSTCLQGFSADLGIDDDSCICVEVHFIEIVYVSFN